MPDNWLERGGNGLDTVDGPPPAAAYAMQDDAKPGNATLSDHRTPAKRLTFRPALMAVKDLDMAKYRIKAEFDLEVFDLDAARVVAKEHLTGVVSRTIKEGGRVETGADTPEAAIDATLENPRAVVSTIVTELLGRGNQSLSMVTGSNLTVTADEIG